MSDSQKIGDYLERLTWPEAKARFDADAIVVIPIGAQSKEHGHHLPLNTDFLLATELTARVVAELPVVAAPVISFGYYPAFRHYPGSQHLKAETFIALLRDLIEGFINQGVKNIAIINTGVSTEEFAMYGLKKAGFMPKAIVNGATAFYITIVGAILAGIPMVYGLSTGCLGLIKSGDYLKVDGDEGVVELRET